MEKVDKTRCVECEALECLINEIKKASPKFAITDQYLRKRLRNGKKCPGTAAFEEGIKIMDRAMAEAVQKYIKLKEEGHEQD